MNVTPVHAEMGVLVLIRSMATYATVLLIGWEGYATRFTMLAVRSLRTVRMVRTAPVHHHHTSSTAHVCQVLQGIGVKQISMIVGQIPALYQKCVTTRSTTSHVDVQ